MAVALLLIGGPVAALEPAPSLRTIIQADDGRHVQVVLVNEGSRAVTLLTRDTPFDAQRLAPPLSIEHRVAPGEGDASFHRVPWQGRQAKRMPPGPDELLVVSPGESVSARVELDQGWHIGNSGAYRVGLVGGWRTAMLPPSELVARSAQRRERLDLAFVSQPPPAPVDMTLLANAVPAPMMLRLRTPEYLQCDAGQQGQILEAASVAERLVAQSVADLRALSAEQLQRSPRYRTWFGAYDAERVDNVISDLSAISETITGSQISFHCDCTEPGVYAYVFPARPYDVWLCPAFWNASLEGTDSRSGTVIHEVSHFRIVAATSDHVYTHARSQELASNDPDRAIDNADSFEYFVENTPAIPLRATGDEGLSAIPAADRPGSGEEALAKGQARSYLIERGRSAFVESLSGDADLELYPGRNDSGQEPLCVSRQAPEISRLDRCELTGDGPWTAVVVAYTDTRYRFAIEGGAGAGRGQDRPADDDGSFATLAGGGGAIGPLGALLAGMLAAGRLVRGGRGWQLCAPALLVVCLCGAGCASVSLAAAPSLDLSLEAVPQTPTSVRITAYNRSSESIDLLSWNTPFEPILSADVFSIASEAERMSYTGRMVKRSLPAPTGAWITLRPGESRDVQIDLSRHYAFEGEGPWTVELEVSGFEVSADANAVSNVRLAGVPVVLGRRASVGVPAIRD